MIFYSPPKLAKRISLQSNITRRRRIKLPKAIPLGVSRISLPKPTPQASSEAHYTALSCDKLAAGEYNSKDLRNRRSFVCSPTEPCTRRNGTLFLQGGALCATLLLPASHGLWGQVNTTGMGRSANHCSIYFELL